jgi:hypothetical protein
MAYLIRRTLFTKSPISLLARSASRKRLLMLNSLPASYSSVGPCRRCTCQINLQRSAGRFGARLRCTAVTLRDETSNLSRTCGWSRPGERATGLRVSIRLSSSSSWSRAPGARSSSTIRVFQRARRRALLRDGKRTIGSRLPGFWHKNCAGVVHETPSLDGAPGALLRTHRLDEELSFRLGINWLLRRRQSSGDQGVDGLRADVVCLLENDVAHSATVPL